MDQSWNQSGRGGEEERKEIREQLLHGRVDILGNPAAGDDTGYILSPLF